MTALALLPYPVSGLNGANEGLTSRVRMECQTQGSPSSKTSSGPVHRTGQVSGR